MTHASAWFEIRKTLEDTPMAGDATSADLDTVTDAIVKLLNESLDLRIWVPERPGRYEMATWGGTQFLDGGATVVLRCQDCGPVARRLVPNDTDMNRVQHEITIWADRESGAHTRERHQPEAVPEPEPAEAELEPEPERTDCPSCPHARHQGACLVAGQTEGQACLCATRYALPVPCGWCRHPVSEHMARTGCSHNGTCPCGLDRVAAMTEPKA